MADKLPNILLIVADCARSDKWMGNNRTTFTPNFDHICREGVSFPTTIAEKCLTTPSFVNILTGLYSPRHGVHQAWGYRLPDAVPLLTSILRDLDYQCCAEVTGPLLPELGLERGFDMYEYRAPNDYLHTAWGDRLMQRMHNGYYKKPWFLLLHLWELHLPRQKTPENHRSGSEKNDYEHAISSLDAQLGRVFGAMDENTLIIFTGDHGEKTEAETYREGTAVDYACKRLNIKRAKGRALYEIAFLTGPSVVHQLYAESVIPMLDMIDIDETVDGFSFGWWTRFRDFLRLFPLMPKKLGKDLFFIQSPLKQTAMLKKKKLLDEEYSRKKIKRFLQSVNRDKLLDMQARMFINTYRKNLHEGHAIHVYDFLVKVPLVFHWTGRLPPGVVYEGVIKLIDVLPTVCDLIGVDPKHWHGIDGQSCKPQIEDRSKEASAAFVSVTGVPPDFLIHGVRTEKYKYTYGPKNPEFPEELYDLRSDPGEMLNLAGEERELCAELRQLTKSLIPDEDLKKAELITLGKTQEEQIHKSLRDMGYLD
jgi:arylsulfatase A-like enzyme